MTLSVRALISAAVLAVILVFAAIFPLVFNGQLTTFYAVITLLFVGAVVAWNLFSGYSGYISLGHAVFFGVGAYTVGLIVSHQGLTGGVVFALMPLGGLAGAAVAVPFGLIALRVRRHTFVVVTIAVFFIFQNMAFNLAFTNGNGGVSAPFQSWNPATSNNPFYYMALGIAVFAVALSWLMRRSKFGLQLRAIRDDEDRARGLGVKPMRVKLAAFVVSALIVGTIGALWWDFIFQVLPETGFDPSLDLSWALMGFLGGFGTVWGPVIGALILEPLQLWTTQNFSTNPYIGEIALGGLFLLVIIFLPRGLLPTGKDWLTALRAWWDRRRQLARGGGGQAQPVPARPAEHTPIPGRGGAR
jgi:branched-chain amino acid transport system permease protein